MECSEPFSQNLYRVNKPPSKCHGVTNSRMMYNESVDFTKPWYFTILGCCMGCKLAVMIADIGRTYVEVFQEVDFLL